ncbi:rRNA maturation RNase YbeY [Pectinatus haikarae]|uniref:Endoribonuclease YbeY n=1 Tax=Pectinatus haikarae TaxID=349096 RepID=A0ABT9YBB8_9FIRM|nr:rRNA maturation RNase YbeY [Pectinatus haikarae]MDQ0205132.1 putative rRNA maturation factor [Pectinatus haikarae]
MQTIIDKNPDSIELDKSLVDIIEQVAAKMAELYDLKNSEVSITLTDNKNIHALNKKYRNIDRPTDVLSFALNEGEEPNIEGGAPVNVLGDIIISVEKTAKQAEEYGHSVKREIAFLTVHGMLHLLGYDHIEENDRVEMRREEEFIMEKLGISR